MISYGPRAIKKDGVLNGRWDYTITDHIGKVWPVGYCAKWRSEGHLGGHHETASQAARCFAIYTIENIRFDGSNIMLFNCFICGFETFRCAMVNGEAFLPICGASCAKKFKKEAIERFQKAAIDVYSEACDDGL